MTNNEILSLYEGLQSVKNSGDIKFPARTTFIVVRNMKTLEPIVDAIVEAKNGLLKELGIYEKDIDILSEFINDDNINISEVIIILKNKYDEYVNKISFISKYIINRL